jgi:calcineurin-like phosphoesterase family protein
MLDNWNQRVGEQDLVLHLGDFAFKEPERYLNQLNGRILLLLGNHDIPALNALLDYAQRRPDKLYVLQQCEGLVTPKGVSGLVKTLGDKKLMFTHYPLISDDPYIRGSARKSRNAMAEVFMQMDCEWSIHGHVHSKDSQLDENEINVSMERTEFAPIKLGELIASRIG